MCNVFRDYYRLSYKYINMYVITAEYKQKKKFRGQETEYLPNICKFNIGRSSQVGYIILYLYVLHDSYQKYIKKKTQINMSEIKK